MQSQQQPGFTLPPMQPGMPYQQPLQQYYQPQPPNLQYPQQYNYGPVMTNPTQYTQVSMDYLNVAQQPPRPIETLQFLPTCLQKCLMAPFPFCCAGCCVSKLTTFQFNNENKVLTIQTQPGYCCACRDTHTIPYRQIMQCREQMDPTCRSGGSKGRRGGYTYFLLLETKIGDYKLTSSKSKAEILSHKTILDRLMKRCSIAIK